MKIQSLCFVLLFCIAGSLKAMDLSITHNTFKGPTYNFVELHLFVLGTSVTFIPATDNQLQAGLEVLLLIKKDTSIVQYDKYQLNSPLAVKTVNFLDIKRYALENGTYNLEVIVTDLNDSINTKTHHSTIEVQYNDEDLALSDIQLLGSFQKDTLNSPVAKNGFLMENLPFNFYTKSADKLMFYVEIYNSDKQIGDQYLVRYFIERLAGNGKRRPMITGHKKRSPKAVNILLLQKSIAELPSGNYNLRVQLRNQKNELLTTKNVAFQRSNPPVVYKPEEPAKEVASINNFTTKMSAKELRYSLKAIAPIIDDSGVEVLNMVIGEKDTLAQRRMLFTFWNGQDAKDPEGSYIGYMEVAKAVDQLYASGFGYGFESDRGFIFMKYGKPNDVIREENEPSAPPYEIWSYNDFPRTKQRNVKFLFYNPSLATGQFQLLHSTARGEINNPQWEVELYRGDTNTMNNTDFDSTTVPDGFNRRARKYFTDF